MDRDVAIQILTVLTNINTNVQTIATNATPSVSNSNRASDQDLRTLEEIPDEVAEPEQDPEPEPQTNTRKK